jgi:Zn ribbon nucleic-acid-binding protein
MPKMYKVTCPCCDGAKVLKIWYPDEVTPRTEMCGHCEGTGEIDAEVADEDHNNSGSS